MLLIGFGASPRDCFHRLGLGAIKSCNAGRRRVTWRPPPRSLPRFLRSPRRVRAIFALSIVIQLLTALAAWCAARSVGTDMSLLYSLFLVPPVILVTVVPISIAGWGVRESAMIAAFGYAGLAQSDGLIVSLAIRDRLSCCRHRRRVGLGRSPSIGAIEISFRRPRSTADGGASALRGSASFRVLQVMQLAFGLRSASTMMRTSSSKLVRGCQPSSLRALDGSPSSWSTSVGRK